MSLSQRIKQLREAKDWYQKELADQVKVSISAISQWERGEAEPEPPHRRKLCQIFGITEAALFYEPATDLLSTSHPLQILLNQLGYSKQQTRALDDSDWQTIKIILDPVIRGLLARKGQMPDNNSPPPNAPPTKSVFIVDDEAKLCHLLSEFLKMNHITVDYAFNGKMAIEKLIQNDTHPTVIILDLRMPEMGGIEFIKRLRKINHESKLLVCSTYTEDLCALGTTGLQVDAVMEKPLDLQTLLKKLHALMG